MHFALCPMSLPTPCCLPPVLRSPSVVSYNRNAMNTERKPLLVVLDGHGIIHRAYHAMRDQPLTVRRTGEPVGAVYGFVNTLLSVLDELKPTHVAVALDPSGPHVPTREGRALQAPPPPRARGLAPAGGPLRELIEAFDIPICRV